MSSLPILASVLAPALGEHDGLHGCICRIGGVNGDDVPDLAWVKIPAGELHVVSGADFEPLYVVELGKFPLPPLERR